MKTKLIALFVSNCLFLAPAFAGADGSTSPVKGLLYYTGHTGLLVTQEQMVDPDACGRKDYYILSKDHPSYKEVTALIISAHLSAQPLVFHVSGCVQGIPSIIHVRSTR